MKPADLGPTTTAMVAGVDQEEVGQKWIQQISKERVIFESRVGMCFPVIFIIFSLRFN